MKTIVLDIDETICSQVTPDKYPYAIPIKKMIDKINYYYDNGFVIYFETARHMIHQKTTIDWLKKYGVKYHHIFFGKPLGDYYVDSKNKTIEQFLKGEL